MAGAVLNALNIRLDAEAIAFILEHGEAKVLITDREFSAVIARRSATARSAGRSSSTSTIRLPKGGDLLGELDYEAFLDDGDPDFAWDTAGRRMARDRAQLHLGHHRQPQGRRLPPPRRLPERASATRWPGRCRSTRSICGRCRCSTATAGASPGPSPPQAGTNVCLRRVDAPRRSSTPSPTHGVTHLCGAPIVLSMLINAPDEPSAARSPHASR